MQQRPLTDTKGLNPYEILCSCIGPDQAMELAGWVVSIEKVQRRIGSVPDGTEYFWVCGDICGFWIAANSKQSRPIQHDYNSSFNPCPYVLQCCYLIRWLAMKDIEYPIYAVGYLNRYKLRLS